MAEVDTSSYPKLPTSPPNFLDVAGKYQGLQQGQQAIQSNALSIQKQQLDQIQQRFTAISGQIPGLLSKKDLNEGDITNFYQNNVKEKLITPDMAATEIGQIPPTAGMPSAQAAQVLKNHLSNKLQMGMNIMDALKFHLGDSGTINNGAVQQPTLISPKPGFGGLPNGGVVGTQPGIPSQLPPGTPIVSQGQPGQPPQGTPGYVGPTNTNPLPVGPMANPPATAPQSMGGGKVNGINIGPDTGAGAKPQPFTASGNPPQFDEGKKQLAADQDMATQRLTAIKQAQQALPLMAGIMSGPTTATFTNALATAKAYGIISTTVNDPVIARQEVLKKLNAYVGSSPLAGRSDAGLLQTEASSPNPNIQNLPALKKLTVDAISMDRLQAARAGAFNNQDLSKYPTFRSTFPAQMDERAFGLDLMEPKERNELLTRMTKNANTFEGKKFWKSLKIVDDQGLIDTGAGQ